MPWLLFLLLNMPRELETYTASGNLRQGPVAAGTPASALTQPWDALGDVGKSIQFTAAQATQIQEQRLREDNTAFVTDAATQLKADLIKWERDPANQGREDMGQAYREYADKQLAEYLKKAPNARAGEAFKRAITPSILVDWENNLKRGEAIRFENFKVGQIKSATIENEAYQGRVLTDPEAAGGLRSQALVQQLAAIEYTYGKIAPANAAEMQEAAVINAVDGVMESDFTLAREMLNEHLVVSPEARRVKMKQIDVAEANAKETGTFNAVELVKNSIRFGYEKLKPVPQPDPALLGTLPKNMAAKITHDVAVANGTISKYSEFKSWNWKDQQKAISAIDIENDPVAGEVKDNLKKLLSESQEQQTKNPAGWQLTNDPEFAKMDERINALPVERRTGQRMIELNRMIALQGPPPDGTTPEQSRRYLNLPTGLQNVLSLDAAKQRSQSMNNVPPNQLTKAVADFDAEFPDPKLAAMAWNDMQNLPEGEGKLKMGIRVASAINDIQVRNNFLGVMSNKDVLKTEDKQSKFTEEMEGREQYTRFISGWLGDGNQRSNELAEFRDSVTRYAMHISASENLKTGAAVDKAIARVITDNYGMMSINGSDVPVYRFPKGGRPLSDADIAYMQVGISDLLDTLSPSTVSTDPFHFPLAPRLPGDQSEAYRYLNKAIKQTGTVAVEADGKSASVYIKGEGENDFPFQARNKQGEPLLFDFEGAITRGKIITNENQTMWSGTLQQKEMIQEKRKRESYRRLGINPDTGRKY
jgi:hypothetical protein